MRHSLVRAVAGLAFAAAPASLLAQKVPKPSFTPYAGYLVTGNWYNGPIGTSLSTTNAVVVGAQVGVPIVKGVSITGSVSHASGDLRIGLPILGGVNVGRNKMWLYDADIELGGLAGRGSGIAPFVMGGIGGISNDISNSLLDTHSTNLAYIAGVGVDIGASKSFALRVQAKDYIGRFDSRDAVGFKVEGNLAHNLALSAGIKLTM